MRKKHKKYLIGGKYMTKKEIARQPWCPVTDTTIHMRLKRGMSIVEACTIPPYDTARVWPYKGKNRTISYLSKLPECVVSYHTLWFRLNYQDWPSVELAMTMPALPPKERAGLKWRHEKMWLQPVSKIIERTKSDD